MKRAGWFRAVAFATALLALACAAPRIASAGPDDTLGMALMGATVGANGTLHHAAGAVSASRSATGEYSVVFERSLWACFYSVTVLNTRTFVRGLTNGSTVYVSTFDVAGAPYDTLFTVLVYCAK